MQTPRSGVVPQSLPEQTHLLQRGRRQRLNSREGLHPTLPIRQDHPQLGLLQHHLGDPDAVGIQVILRPRPSPLWREHPRLLSRISAAMHLPPGQKRMPQGHSREPERLRHRRVQKTRHRDQASASTDHDPFIEIASMREVR